MGRRPAARAARRHSFESPSLSGARWPGVEHRGTVPPALAAQRVCAPH